MDFSSADIPISRETWAPQSDPSGSSSAPPYSTSAPTSRAPLPDSSGDDYVPRPSPSSAYVPRPDNGRDLYRGDGANGSAGPPPSNSGPYVPPFRQGDTRDGPQDMSRAPRRPPNAPAPEPNPVIGVFGLSVRTKERDLEDEFGKYGDVEKVTIVYDQRTDRSRGFGFITMRKTEHAAAAIKHLNGYNLHGRTIRVDYSSTQKAHNPTPGQYMGEKKPIHGLDDRYRGRYGEDRGDYRRDDRRYDDRRGYDRDRYDDRRGYDDRRDRPRRDIDDPYGGRSRRDDDRRRSPSPRRRYSRSPDRRPARDYDAPQSSGPAPPAETASLRY